MAKNSNLNKAKEQKNDEFYTQISDIEKELKHYKEHFRDKIVFCNCDDPEESHFWLYFKLNFYQLGLKKLISTHYDDTKSTYKLEIARQEPRDDGQMNIIPDVIKTPLKCNGDFRSDECVEILKEADIVVTNPPFSLFREYIAQLMDYNKKFIIIGSINAVKYKEIFPLIKDNKIWLGYGFNETMIFSMPDFYEVTSNGYVGENGKKYGKVAGIAWFTNLEIKKRMEEIILYKRYNENEYIKYDNFDAINVDKTSDIPCDYDGLIGVPITFLGQYNPDQFELLGMGTGDTAKLIGVKKNYRGRTDLSITRNGKQSCPYTRVVIKNKKVVKGC